MKTRILIIALVIVGLVVSAFTLNNSSNSLSEKAVVPYLDVTVKTLSGTPQPNAEVRVTLPNGNPHPDNPKKTDMNGQAFFSLDGQSSGSYFCVGKWPYPPSDDRSGTTTISYGGTGDAHAIVVLNVFY